MKFVLVTILVTITRPSAALGQGFNLSSAECFNPKEVSAINLFLEWSAYEVDGSDGYCYDNYGTGYERGQEYISCEGCMKYNCSSLPCNARDGSKFKTFWLLDSVDSQCCQNCEGKIFPPNEIVSTTSLEDKCDTMEQATCKTSSDGSGGPVGTIEVSYTSGNCCLDKTTWSPAGTTILEKDTCSERTCRKGRPAQWDRHTKYQGGCGCCVYKSAMLLPGECRTLKDGRQACCCDWEMVVNVEEKPQTTKYITTPQTTTFITTPKSSYTFTPLFRTTSATPTSSSSSATTSAPTTSTATIPATTTATTTAPTSATTTASTTASGIPLFATCDDHMRVYFDGVLHYQDSDWGTVGNGQWETTTELVIPSGTKMLGIECRNERGLNGILASWADAMVTDGNWLCTSNKTLVGWAEDGLTGGEFAAAITVQGPSKVAHRPNILPSANWIWGDQDDWAACKIMLGDATTTETTTASTTATTIATTTAATTASGIPLFATCDDHMRVYFDGVLHYQDSDWGTVGNGQWETTTELVIPSGTKMLGIECESDRGLNGILASWADGMVTDGNWLCTSNKTLVGWAEPGLAGGEFAAAITVQGPSKVADRPKILPSANWIWGDQDDWAACKMMLGQDLCTWTDWFNRDGPTWTGDYEVFNETQGTGFSGCNFKQIEMRVVGTTAIYTTEAGVLAGNGDIVHITNEGMYCKWTDCKGCPANGEQPDGTCFDYEVRFCSLI